MDREQAAIIAREVARTHAQRLFKSEMKGDSYYTLMSVEIIVDEVIIALYLANYSTAFMAAINDAVLTPITYEELSNAGFSV